MSQARPTAELFERTAVHDRGPDAALRPSEAARLAETLALIPPTVTSLLDVGCGPGTFLHRLPAHVTARFGTDLGRRGMRNARVPVLRSSIFELPFADASLDLVSCLEVLEHLPPAQVPQAIAELCRVARHHVLVSVPYKEQLLETSHRCPRCGHVFHLHGHQQSMDESSLAPHFPPGRPLTVRFAWRHRPYSPTLLRLRTHRLGAWKYSPHSYCPACGCSDLANREGGLRWKLVGALNHLRHPTRSQPNWLLMRCDL